MAIRLEINATTVLPEPTSPWSIRFIGWGSDISPFISEITFSCAAVNLNGSILLKFSTLPRQAESVLKAIPASLPMPCFFNASPNSRENSSSKTTLFRGSQSLDSSELGVGSSEMGLCTSDTAFVNSISPYRFKILNGTEPTAWDTNSSNMYQKTIRRIIRGIIDEFVSHEVGSVPLSILKRYGLMELTNAVSEVHKPISELPTPNSELSKDWLPRKSVVFDELFSLELGLALKKQSMGKETGIAFNTDSASLGRVENFRRMLPFRLTAAQERVISEIKGDMSEPHPINRLLQGDVGSGKTVVAFISSMIAIENGCQAAIMAPTEILAEQHYLNIYKYAEKLGIKTVLLTSSLAKTERNTALAGIKSNDISLAIGTHALIQEDVEFSKLGLVIIDEQHRFGVIQRAMLKKKGQGTRGRGQEKSGLDPGYLTLNPDVLVMTATPIPRTLSMTVFGDLDISIIDELPPGRRPIKTK